ncbi:hypothetical protein AX14_000522 [Amanita brunnescens Koide BX004]|nr:hypothetical protein AX14_000522 [Amanita brunnescens Koide BX004]
MAANDVYRGFPSPSAQSLSSSSSSASLPRAGLGALAAVVEHAIARWARRRGLSSSSSSASSLPSRSSASLNARTKFTRYGRDSVTFLSSDSERKFSAHIALVKARKAPRQVHRQFTLYLPPALLSGRHRPDLPHGFTTTSSLSLILGQLELICRHSYAHEGGQFEANYIEVNSASSRFTSTARDRKGKKKANPFPVIAEQNLSASSQKAWYLEVASPSWEDLREIGKLLHLHPLTLEDVLQNEPREKLELFSKLGYYFISFRAMETRENARNTDLIFEDPVGETNVYLAVFKDGICCFHFSDISEHTDRVRVRIQRLGEVFNMSADWIAHGLLDSIVDSFFPYVEQVDKEIVAIGKLIFSRRDQLPANEVNGSPFPKMEHSAPLRKELDLLGTGQDDDEKFEVTSDKMDFGDKDRRIRYSISCLPVLNLLRHFRRPASPLPENLSQNSKNTLRRIARVRRMVTLLGRLLATKSEVVAQIRKRLLADGRFGVSTGSNVDTLDIAMHMDDVQVFFSSL